MESDWNSLQLALRTAFCSPLWMWVWFTQWTYSKREAVLGQRARESLDIHILKGIEMM